MKEATNHREHYQEKNLEIVKGKKAFLEEQISQLLYMTRRLKEPYMELDILLDLKGKTEELISLISQNSDNKHAGAVMKVIDKLKKSLNDSENSYKTLEEQLKEINTFIKVSENAEFSVKVNYIEAVLMSLRKFWKK
jgi:predicted RNase H-like nuclease (RuvC/YqgF family)